MRKRRRKLHINKKLVVVLAILLSVGFAYITSAVNIGGVFTVFSSTYDVHFENLQVTEGSVEANAPTIDSENTEVSASVKFNNPGDYYEFTVDAVNAGDIDAMINTVSDIELTEDQEKYLDYTVTYADGEEPIKYHQLNSGDRCTFKVKASFKEDIATEDLPEEGDNVEVVLDTDYVKADSNRIKRRAEYNLYNVLKDEANSGSLAKKYTGEHQDSMDVSLSTKDIYHWYAANETDGTTIKNKNNVIFANHCWQLIRTTDTGGARLLYNGEVENNQCLDSRGTHVGYNGYSHTLLNSYYYYGTDYEYDSINNVFSIAGEIEQEIWNDSTYEDLIGKYTCRKTTPNETCSQIYLIDSYNSSAYANIILINSNANYTDIGKLRYNRSEISLAFVGYMYNKVYNQMKRNLLSTKELYITDSNGLSIDNWYADSVEILNDNTYKLVNPYKVNSTDEYESLIGKYTLKNNDANYASTTAYYIVDTNSNTGCFVELAEGHNLDYYNPVYTYGSSYTDNGDGTYTINSPSQINIIDYHNNKNNIVNNYACENAVNNTCSNLIYIVSTYYTNGYRYYSVLNKYKIANGFTYENGNYTLNNDGITTWDFRIQTLSNYHYTCWNESGICDTISYMYSFGYSAGQTLYLSMTNGKSISDIVNEMLNSDDVNKYNSVNKTGIESWYKHKIFDYNSYIEDTIYCNRRIIVANSGLNPQNQLYNIGSTIGFTRNNQLTCTNLTDSFSVSNNKAKLQYPVGLISAEEITEMNKYKNIFYTGQTYYTISPSDMQEGRLQQTVIYSDGRIEGTHIAYERSVRPYISLSPTTFYTSGDGTMENPYVIYTE